MPRSMGHPNYRYTPWTPERRKRASEAGKERWRKKREAEQAEWDRRQASVIGRVEIRIRDENRKMEIARVEYFRAKAAIEQLSEAREALYKVDRILKVQGLEPL